MQRALGMTIVVLAALVVIQFAALRRMRLELAELHVRAAAFDVETRRDEIVRAGDWLHAWLQTQDGGQRPQGLCPGGAPAIDVIRAQVFGTYLQARAGGAAEREARDAVVARMR